MMKTPSQTILDKAKAIASGCIDDWDGEEPGIAPYDYACRALAMLTSPVKAEREEAKALVRRWRTFNVSHAKPTPE